jgi:hypothetical protein
MHCWWQVRWSPVRTGKEGVQLLTLGALGTPLPWHSMQLGWVLVFTQRKGIFFFGKDGFSCRLND